MTILGKNLIHKNKSIVLLIILCLYSCKSEKIIITENEIDEDDIDLLEYFRNEDKYFDNKTFVVFENIGDKIEHFKLIEKKSEKNLLFQTLESHTNYLYQDSYVYSIYKNQNYVLYIDNIIYNIPVKMIQKYRYLTIKYSLQLKKYIIEYSNYRKGFI